MAVVQVCVTGLHAQRWSHVARSTLVRMSYTLFARRSGVDGTVGGCDICCMSTRYILERLSREPTMVGAVGCLRTARSGPNQHSYPASAKTPTERRER